MKNKSFFIIILVLSIIASTTYISAEENCLHQEGLCNYVENEEKVVLMEHKKICQADISDEFLNDELIIVLNNSSSLELKEYNLIDFKEINCIEIQDLTSSYVTKIKEGNIQRTKSNLGINTKTFNRILKLKISSNEKSEVLSAIKILEQRSDVLSAEPVYTDFEWCAIPNDIEYNSSFDKRWAYEKIQLPEAWNISTGDTSVLVGVIDTGIDIEFSDLSTPVNQSLSRRFINDGISPVEDEFLHGTLTAGVVGAKGNNNIGMTGVCWNVSLVSLKVDKYFDYDDYSSSHDVDMAAVIASIDYANQLNIPILNFSATLNEETSGLYEAIENYNGLFVCAAGNNGLNNDERDAFPSNYRLPNLISVGSSDINDTRSSFSNYGNENVDIFAPGSNIWVGAKIGNNNYYDFADGTSFSAPFVSGVAAMILSRYPSLTSSELKQTIMMNVDDADDGVTAFTDVCVSGGRLNAYKAITNPHIHSFVYSDGNISGHNATCNLCAYEVVEEHNYSNYAVCDSMTHYSMCIQCNYLKRSFHRWSALEDGSGSICVFCGYISIYSDNDEE